MSFKAILYAYIIGGLTFIPLLLCAAIAWTIYTSVPVGDPDPTKLERKKLAEESRKDEEKASLLSLDDQPKPRKGWITVRRTFEPKESDGSYVTMMRQFLDARSKDPKRSRPKDMWYVVLKGNVLYLYEDESMTECEAVIHLSSHDIIVYPEGLADGELFTKRNAIMLKPRAKDSHKRLPSLTKEMSFDPEILKDEINELDSKDKSTWKEKERLEEVQRLKMAAKEQALDNAAPWFMFVRTCVEMEDWYLALVHASNYSSQSLLEPVRSVFSAVDMHHLVSTLDEQPDVIPMRWLNALLGRLFYSFYRTQHLENFIIGRLMKKLSKVKAPSFLQDISVTNVSVGNTPPALSKPMLKELTKEGDAALELRLSFKGEVRITAQATAIINLGQRFKTYTVKLVLAVVLRKLDGNLLIKVKRPPSDRIWYAFTQPPEIELDVEPVVSDRQLKWSMICSTIESRLREILNESVVLPNMDDIAFFDSEAYSHRGGIWADACRKVQLVPEPNNVNAEDSVVDVDPELVAKSNSASDAVDLVNGSSSKEGMIQTVLESAPELPTTTSQKTANSEPLSKSSIADGQNDSKKLSPEDGRGRSPTVESIGRRATSVPAAKSASVETFDGAGPQTSQIDTVSQTEDSADSSETEISSSVHSRVRSLSSGANMLNSTFAGSRESLASRTSNATNTSSFLSALKAKDKQALSNSAKEAMRKWSANWSGFKRDRTGETNTDELAADGITQGSMSSLFSKGRNFSDLRAAVSARRDTRETPPSETSVKTGSAPIDIPSKKARSSMEVETGSSSYQEISDSSPAPQTQSPKGPSILRQESSRASPSPPKLSTETHSVLALSPSSTKASELEEEQTKPTAPPIKTQPSQGAMMTIPGIHASHRGDIMSYSYVPPSPSTPTSTTNKRSSAIQPTIQSMYRLFKTTSANSSVPDKTDDSAESTTLLRVPTNERSPSQRNSLALETDSISSNDDAIPQHSLSIPQSQTSTDHQIDESLSNQHVKRKPPPLPPRTNSIPPSLPPREQPPTNATPDISQTTKDNSPPLLDSTTPGQSLAPSASESLKLIAELDETKRKDLESSSSPENRPRASGGKRNSLGARRITNVTTDEPQSYSAASNRTTDHSDAAEDIDVVTRVQSLPAVADQSTSQSSDAKLSAIEAKPKPPPLPPRNNTTLISASS